MTFHGREGGVAVKSMEILDAHVHAFGDSLACLEQLQSLEMHFGYTGCNLLSCPCMPQGGAGQNAFAIAIKLLWPQAYAFGGLEYRSGTTPAEQLETLLELGLDGVKMIEQKPTLRRALGVPFNDPRYDAFYTELSRRGFPLLAHVADPEEFWDETKIPSWAKAAGYDYSGGGYPAKEELYAEVEDVLRRFPRLRIILAHLFFLSADIQRLDRLMARHPNVYLDVVAGTEMYFNFTKEPELWRSFFLQYQDRIIFGTDNSNMDEPEELTNAQITNRMEIGFLTGNELIPAWDKRVQGIGLPPEACEKILGGNFRRLAGARPRPIDCAAAARYLRRQLDRTGEPLEAGEENVLRQTLALVEEKTPEKGDHT